MDLVVTDNDAGGSVMQKQSVIKFLLPFLSNKAKSFHKIVNRNEQRLQELPVLRDLTDIQVEALRTSPLKIYNPCHDQAVERHIKAVTEASMQATNFQTRDGIITQKLKSRTLMKVYDTERQFLL